MRSAQLVIVLEQSRAVWLLNIPSDNGRTPASTPASLASLTHSSE
jgi:hypothetical protein